ncbi:MULTISPECIES: hypothetical protein [Streptomyces]|uniref:GNAT family N-acetyltransferase n=1 Tax=Streptomyces sp. NBC_00093 TaxID=2975649 RepID=A0AAU1ZWU6_9ACTN
MTTATDLTVRQVTVADPLVEPLLRELGDEYSTRYLDSFAVHRTSAR